VIHFETTLGSFTVQLAADKAPKTTQNFIDYVNEGHYDGLIFHRIIPNFMAQGGGMDSSLTPKKTKSPIKSEADNGLSNKRGSIAMARTQDPHSATSQFYINLVDNHFLDYSSNPPGYTVFGEVVEGMDVIDAMAKVSTTNRRGYQDVPFDDIVIIKATVKTAHSAQADASDSKPAKAVKAAKATKTTTPKTTTPKTPKPKAAPKAKKASKRK
jgi:peptidyl-prolyl cis-trans isomerase B (cyclophilin B)